MHRTIVFLLFILLPVSQALSQKLERVTIAGNRTFTVKQIFPVIKSRWLSALDSVQAEQDRRAIESFYQEQGFLEISCLYQVEKGKRKKSSRLVFLINEGSLYRFGTIRITGARSVNTYFINNFLEFAPGMPFSKDLILKSQIEAMETGLFENFKILADSVDILERRISVRIQVKERNMHSIDSGIGIDSEDGARATVGWEHRNIDGNGRSVFMNGIYSISYSSSFYAKKKGIGASYLEPYLADLPLNGRLNINWVSDKPNYVNYGFESFSIEAILQYRFSLIHQMLLRSRMQNTRLFNIPFDAEEREFQERFGIDNNRSVSATFIRDTRDDHVDPSSGMYLSAMLEKAGGFLKGDNDYWKTLIYFNRYIQVYRRWIFAQHTGTGLLELQSDDDRLPSYLRFFMGGAGSVRGFSSRSLGPREPDGSASGGNFMLLSKSEMRYYLNYNISFVAFVDFGNVWRTRKHFKWNSFNSAAGLGVRLRTQFGFFRLDLAAKLSEFDNGSIGRIHFGFGQSF